MKEAKQFENLGGQLKKIRLDANKTLTDVSGALELSERQLSAIERGEERPHEELILLLASYFKLSKMQTQKLLYLAGYNKGSQKAKARSKKDNFAAFLEDFLGKHMLDSQHFMIAFSEKIQEKAIYTNETSVNVSQNGVIIKFAQSTFVDKAAISVPVAKVGMSLEHAHQLNKILTKALKKVERSDQVSDELQ